MLEGSRGKFCTAGFCCILLLRQVLKQVWLGLAAALKFLLDLVMMGH